MKHRLGFLFATLAVALLLGVSGCEKKGPAESAGEKLDQTMEKAGEKVEEAGESIQDAAEGQK